MGLFARIFHKKDKTPTVVARGVQKVRNLGRAKSKIYTSTVVLTFNGEGVAKIPLNNKGFSAKDAKEKLQKGLDVKIVRTYQNKKQW